MFFLFVFGNSCALSDPFWADMDKTRKLRVGMLVQSLWLDSNELENPLIESIESFVRKILIIWLKKMNHLFEAHESPV